LRFGGGTGKSSRRHWIIQATEKETLQNLDENRSKSSGRVTSPVNFALAVPICPRPYRQKSCLPLKIAMLSLVATWHFACSPQPL